MTHEHVFVLSADVQHNYPAKWGSEDERVADAVTRLTALHALGVTPSSIRLSWGCRLAPASLTTRHLLAPSRGPPACTLMTHYLCRRTRSRGAEHLILLRMALASHRCR